MSDVFEQNFNESLEVMRSAGQWRSDHSAYSKFWDPVLITPSTYLEEFYEDQAWVLRRGGVAIAAATLSEPNRRKMGSWKEELGGAYDSSSVLYLDNLAVRSNLIGQGIIVALLRAIEERARQAKFDYLRLDCDDAISKLEECYERNGFSVVTRKDVGHRISVFMEKTVVAKSS